MILYGSEISPYVRRIALWCTLQGRSFEWRKLRAMGEQWDEIRAHNPVGRVPILILDDGTELIETWAICDWLEQSASASARLLPSEGVARRRAMQRVALATATVDKAVAMVYERNRRPEELHWKEWQDRLTIQIRDGLKAMDDALTPGFHGADAPDGVDIATVTTYDAIRHMNPWLLDPGYPNLEDFSERANAIQAIGDTRPEP